MKELFGKLYVTVRNFFTNQYRLTAFCNHMFFQHHVLRERVLACDDMDALLLLHSSIVTGKDIDTPRIMPGTDFGKGLITIGHWATQIYASAFMDMLDEHNATNYVEAKFKDKNDKIVTVTVQRYGMLTPHDKVKVLEARVKELEDDIQN